MARRSSARSRARSSSRSRAGLVDQAPELRGFREIATLQPVEVERPPDAPTDWAGAAAAARARGMNRLAERLEGFGRVGG